MKPIANIGAVPVFASLADIPAFLKVPGARFAVWRGGDEYQFFGVLGFPPAASGGGLGIALVTAASAGSAGGPVGFLVGLGVSLLPMLGKLFNRGPSQEHRDAGAQFEQLAGQVTSLFNAIQSQPAITPADVGQAEAAFRALSDMAGQFQAVAYVKEKWNSSHYRPAYETRLQHIRQAAAAVAPAPGGGAAPALGGAAPAGQLGGVDIKTLLIGAGVGLLALKLISN